MKQLEVLENYAKAIAIGAYDHHAPGLFGKHDNVRRYWEDRYIRSVIAPFLMPLATRKRSLGSGIRVIDLGCGAGEGLSILTSLHQTPLTLDAKVETVLEESDISCYRGVDISPAMIEKAIALHSTRSQAEFALADLNEGLPVAVGEPGYDIYFSSYGALSHLNDCSLAQLVGDVCNHMDERTIFVVDLLGRYSYEWPCYWGDPQKNASGMNTYSMSYMYAPGTKSESEVLQFPMRFWGGEEFDQFMRKIAERKGVQILCRKLCDRSLLVGRHMNTHEYNPKAPPIRAAINSLLETDCRTDLSQLMFDYNPHPEYSDLNRFFSTLQEAWNAVICACIDALSQWRILQKLPAAPPADEQPVVQDAISMVRNTVRIATMLQGDDPRASFIEPQLAYMLRNLEWNLQQGLGAAHSLLAVYELRK